MGAAQERAFVVAAVDAIAAVAAELIHAGEVLLAALADVIGLPEGRILHADAAFAAGVIGGLQAAGLAQAAVIADLAVDAGEASAVGAIMGRIVLKIGAFHADAADAAGLLGGGQAAVQAEPAVLAELLRAGEGRLAARAEMLGIGIVGAVHAQPAVAAVFLGDLQAAGFAQAAVLAALQVAAFEALAAAVAELRAVYAVGLRVRGAPVALLDVLSALRAVVPRLLAAFKADLGVITALLFLVAFAAGRAVIFSFDSALNTHVAIRTEQVGGRFPAGRGKASIAPIADHAALVAVVMPVDADIAVFFGGKETCPAVIAPGVPFVVTLIAQIEAAQLAHLRGVPEAQRAVILKCPAAVALKAFGAVAFSWRIAFETPVAFGAVLLLPCAVPTQIAIRTEIIVGILEA